MTIINNRNNIVGIKNNTFKNVLQNLFIITLIIIILLLIKQNQINRGINEKSKVWK